MDYPYGNGNERSDHPYGQDMNGYYPYSGQNGGEPGGFYYGAPVPPRKSVADRIRGFFKNDKRAGVFILGFAIGTAILLQQLVTVGFSGIIFSDETVYSLYVNDETASLLIEMMYTVFCVGAPFALVFLLLKLMSVYTGGMPFGKPYKVSHAALLIPAGLGLCFFGNIISSYLVSIASTFGYHFSSYDAALAEQSNMPDTALGIVLTVIHTAVLPALTEEFVFRGCIMQPLRKYGDWFAIITSGIIFGLIHGNMSQAPFAIVAGIALGYVSVVTGTMWTNIILHFLNNFVSVLYSLALTSVGDQYSITVSVIMIYGIIAIGIVAFIGYAYMNRDFLRLRPSKYGPLRKKAAFFWLSPPMVISVAVLIFSILSDIAPV